MSKRKSRYRNKQSEDNVIKLFRINILPKNKKQETLIAAIENSKIVVTLGCAGTGKTYCSAGTIAKLYSQGSYERIVLARSNMPTGKSLGNFPGDIKDKLTPFLMPMLDVLKELFGKGKYEYMLNKGEIELQPLETVRGRSFKNSLILVDEAQNLTMDELKALSTRLGENSKLIFMGDPAQSDHKNGQDLNRFANLLIKNNIEVPVIKFNSNEIVRSDIVADLVKMFIKENI
jgi:phosphate starvation-inducible PhoH-like protein